MRPAMRHSDGRTALSREFGQTVVTGVAIDLQNAVKACKEGFGILARAPRGRRSKPHRADPRRPMVDHRWPAPRGIRSLSPRAPGPAPGQSFHLLPGRRLRSMLPRGHEDLAGPFEMLSQPTHDRLQMERGLADPISQHGAVQIEKSVRGKESDVRLASRREHSAPIIAALKPWLETQLSCIPQKSQLAEDIRSSCHVD